MNAQDKATVRGQIADIRNPYTGYSVGQILYSQLADLDAVVAAAKTYQHHLTPDDRAALLTKSANLLAEQSARFMQLITSESGNCLQDSKKEVERSVVNLRVAAEEAKRLTGRVIPVRIGATERWAMTVYEPCGVVGAITPFNRPLNQVVVKVAPALAANNAIIVKPSEKTPLTAIAFIELLAQAGFPQAMAQVIVGAPGEIGPALVRHPGVDMITFTGGVQTGQAVAAAAGMKKVTLELGGNDPLIVLDDADLAQAAKLAADGAIATAGQSCRGIKRIIVAEAVADAFCCQLETILRGVKYGDPFDPNNTIGTLINEAAAIEVEARCVAAVQAGAKLVFGGRREGACMQPALLDHVRPEMDVVRLETFGPVAPIIRVADIEEAITIANSTAYGLQAGVVTRSYDHFMTIAARLRVGGVALMDGPNFDSPLIPFGGVKQSGLGREGIPYAMREMSILKTIVLPQPNRLPQTVTSLPA